MMKQNIKTGCSILLAATLLSTGFSVKAAQTEPKAIFGQTGEQRVKDTTVIKQIGDRNLPIDQVYPPEAFYHNGKGGRVLEVTDKVVATPDARIEASGPMRHPNIVFILADDLGYMDIGIHGSKYYETPNIDRLATTALRFTDAHAAPVCIPTRAALMTGKSPARLHMTCVRLPGVPLVRTLPLSEYTLAELLRDQGYRTAIFGKWHLSQPVRGQLQDYGFETCVGVSSGTNSYFFPYHLPGLEQGSKGENLTDRLTTEACKFMEENQRNPFFIYLAHHAVHVPLQAKPELLEKYTKKPAFGGQNNPTYAAMVESLDDSVGRVLSKIEALGLAGRTVVIFASDNGGAEHYPHKENPTDVHPTSNAPLRGEKGMLYEGGIRVPLMIQWPGVTRAGTTCDTPVTIEDYYPTIAEISGAAIPAEVRKHLDGTSFAALLRGDLLTRERPMCWHYPHYHDRFPPDPAGAIRDGDWKLIEFFKDGRLELYKLSEDIGETNNLASTMPEKVKELHRKLLAWRKTVGAAMPTPNKPDNTARPAKGKKPAGECVEEGSDCDDRCRGVPDGDCPSHRGRRRPLRSRRPEGQRRRQLQHPSQDRADAAQERKKTPSSG